MLVWILRPKSVEWASVLHQPDGVRSKRYHIVPFGEFNGVPIDFVARFGVISKSTDRIFCNPLSLCACNISDISPLTIWPSSIYLKYVPYRYLWSCGIIYVYAIFVFFDPLWSSICVCLDRFRFSPLTIWLSSAYLKCASYRYSLYFGNYDELCNFVIIYLCVP